MCSVQSDFHLLLTDSLYIQPQLYICHPKVSLQHETVAPLFLYSWALIPPITLEVLNYEMEYLTDMLPRVMDN